ncbi:DUF4190 domain-containing protein [Actinoplanes sp. RD1]|uniref:DUF4190 domain-containing protein n=1 Tax=Actinoplanes sp. RD1 TaxID=3064538 RepID=UPI002741EF9E|nr:DUF4190 domain-containing protein [Actinoplanes sp. RD1]
MTHPPTPDEQGAYPPPADPPIQAYRPPSPPQPPYGIPSQPPFGTVPQPQRSQDPPPYYAQGPSTPYPLPPAFQEQPAPQQYAAYSPFHQPRATNGMAIASLVVSCLAVAGLCVWGFGGLFGLVGAILGHVARKRITVSGEAGAGLALAGIIVGWVVTGIALVAGIGLVALIATDPTV